MRKRISARLVLALSLALTLLLAGGVAFADDRIDGCNLEGVTCSGNV